MVVLMNVVICKSAELGDSVNLAILVILVKLVNLANLVIMDNRGLNGK